MGWCQVSRYGGKGGMVGGPKLGGRVGCIHPKLGDKAGMVGRLGMVMAVRCFVCTVHMVFGKLCDRLNFYKSIILKNRICHA